MNIFHLSLPVKDLEATRFFYCELLGGVQEKTTPDWFNINLKGHQLTFHCIPEEIIASRLLHWGLIVSWDDFHRVFEKLEQHDVPFSRLPDHQETGTPAERVKMVFTDPSNYLIEFKAYKHDLARF